MILLFFLGCSVIALFGEVGFYKTFQDTVSSMKTQTEDMRYGIYYLFANLTAINAIGKGMTDYSEAYGETLNIPLTSMTNITLASYNISNNTASFDSETKKFQIGFLSWVCMMTFFGLVILVLLLLAKNKKPSLASCSTYFSFFFTFLAFGLLAMTNGQMIYILDYCE